LNTKPRYDRYSKTISLAFDFSPYQAPGLKYSGLEIKFRASREAWLQAWGTLNFDALTFADVKPFLSRNRKKAVEALAELATEDPDHFSAVFFDCVMQANSVNPLFQPARKERGGSRYGLEWETSNKVSRLALKLNHVLRVMNRAHFRDRPAYFKNFHEKYFIESGKDTGFVASLETDFDETIIPFKATAFPYVIAKALSDHFGFPFGGNLYETFVKKRGLTLRRLELRQCLLPLADPDLSELFAKFQK
jgi:hypothetical protein